MMASAALSEPMVSTVTLLSSPPSDPAALSASLRPASIAYSSSSESSPSTPNRSVVLSDSLNVGSDWASGTYLTQTTMFIAGCPLSREYDFGFRDILAARTPRKKRPWTVMPDTLTAHRRWGRAKRTRLSGPRTAPCPVRVLRTMPCQCHGHESRRRRRTASALSPGPSRDRPRGHGRWPPWPHEWRMPDRPRSPGHAGAQRRRPHRGRRPHRPDRSAGLPGLRPRDRKIAGQGELTAGTQRLAGDRGHSGLGDPSDRGERGLQGHRPVNHVCVGHGLHLLDVSAGREDLLPAIDDDRPDVAPRGGFERGGVQAILDLEVQRVHRWSFQMDGADAALDLEPDELAHGCSVPTPWSCVLPMTVWCHIWTADRTSSVVTTSSSLTSVSGAMTCSPVTTRVPSAIPALTTFRRRVSSLQAWSWLRASCGTSSPTCHCPKTRMTVKSPSMQRTNICWSWTVKATSPSWSMLGSKPSSIKASSTRPRRGCSLVGGGKFGSEVGSVMCLR